jgi:hypothetical protein
MLQLRSDIPHPPPDHIASADQIEISRVRELINVLRPFNHRDHPWSLLEEGPKAVLLRGVTKAL